MKLEFILQNLLCW